MDLLRPINCRRKILRLKFCLNKVLLKGPAEAWIGRDLTGVLGFTFSDRTAWSRRSNRVMEPPSQYRVSPLPSDLDVVTEYCNPSGQGCDVSFSPPLRMSRPTTVFSGALTSQLKVLLNSLKSDSVVSIVEGLQASRVHSDFRKNHFFFYIVYSLPQLW